VFAGGGGGGSQSKLVVDRSRWYRWGWHSPSYFNYRRSRNRVYWWWWSRGRLSNAYAAGGNGGSGVVIIKVPDTVMATFSSGVDFGNNAPDYNNGLPITA
jgi:hypothetical protein